MVLESTVRDIVQLTFVVKYHGTLDLTVRDDDTKLLPHPRNIREDSETRDWGDKCVEERNAPPPECTDNSTAMTLLGECSCSKNVTIDSALTFNCTQVIENATTSAELFFEREVIQRSVGVEPDNMGEPLWKLTLCLLLTWIVVVFCLIKGIKSSGKVVYFTATFPYLILLILLVRGITLEGAADGVEFFIVPKWSKLADLDVWVKAAGQMFFSLSVSFGGIIMYGSYNKFRNQVYYDSLLISVMDLVTSIIAGFVVFTTFGGMAHKIGTTVDKVAKGEEEEEGGGGEKEEQEEEQEQEQKQEEEEQQEQEQEQGGGGFGLMETVLTCLQDEFPKTRKYKSYICVGLGIGCFLLALPCVCPGGDYVVTIMDHYGADFSVLFLSCFEVISVMWVYDKITVTFTLVGYFQRLHFLFSPNAEWLPADGRQRYLLPDGAAGYGQGVNLPMYKTGLDNPAVVVDK
ncbi:transporter [Elysia marginata]|uniref:Transporter n=1 Tax=Elysia marginata TaxID=1093978 RepID=A0AAV4HG48_9GAST|nr:transporter [Elysia marginata]